VDLKSYLKHKRALIDQALQEKLKSLPYKGLLSSAMTYSLMAGGKRLRPILCLAAAEAVGGDPAEIIPTACAIEMIHTYSLIHDDLPAMDDDTLRRGKPTCHIAFHESTAILAGDALLTWAFQILSSVGNHPADAAKKLRVLNLISKAAGNHGMIEGQIRDISSEGLKLSTTDLEKIHTLKTGALIEASVHAGGLQAGGDSIQIQHLCSYAKNIGLAFQVQDDILNVEGDPAFMGKAVGTDHTLQKNTYTSLMGVEKSKAFAQKLVDDALKALVIFDNKADPLRAVAGYVANRDR
jgi:geranylgeranyl diphosphate synthase, type II